MKKFLVAYLALSVTAAYAATEQSSTTVAPNATAQTTTVTKDEVKPEAAKQWGGKVFLSGFASADLVNKGKASGEVEFYNYVAPTYKIDEKRSAELRLYFTANMEDDTKSDEMDMHNPALVYVHADAYKIADFDITQAARLYLPGSPDARDTGEVQARYYMTTDQEVGGGVVLSHLAQFRGYNRSKSDQSALRYILGSEVSRKFGSFKPFAALYYDERHASTQGESRLGDDGEAIGAFSNRDGSWTYLGTSYKINDKMSLNTYAEQWHQMDTEQNYELMNDDQTSYYVEFSAKM